LETAEDLKEGQEDASRSAAASRASTPTAGAAGVDAKKKTEEESEDDPLQRPDQGADGEEVEADAHSFLRFSSYESSGTVEGASVIETDNRSLTSVITMDDKASFYPSSVHGNLLQAHPRHRDPMRYYEVVKVLGEGSMGSVAKVRRRVRARALTAKPPCLKGRLRRDGDGDGDEDEDENEQVVCCGPILLSLVKFRASLASQKNPFLDSDELSPLANDWSNGSSLRTNNNSGSSGGGGGGGGGSNVGRHSKSSSDSSAPAVLCCTNPTSSSTGAADLRRAWPSSSTIITHGTKRDCFFALKSIHLNRCTNKQYMKELKNEGTRDKCELLSKRSMQPVG
jgi:hypothetical protein